jgi:hypothetical protein
LKEPASMSAFSFDDEVLRLDPTDGAAQGKKHEMFKTLLYLHLRDRFTPRKRSDKED